MITGCNILPASRPCTVYSGLQHQHVTLIAMQEIIPMDRKRWGNNDGKRMAGFLHRDRKGGKRRVLGCNLGTGLLLAEQVDSDTSPCGWHMELIVATAQGGQGEGISGGAAGSHGLRTGKGKVDGAEGWYRCQSPAKSAICHRILAKSHWPVMQQKWWETCLDQSLWAGSCPFSMADSQQRLTMHWCRQSTGRYFLYTVHESV